MAVTKPVVAPPKPRAVCAICGSSDFGPGPLGRLSPTGHQPGCQQCGSLERHRALRRLFEALPIGLLYKRRALQFSNDVAMVPQWFAQYEVSQYGRENSLDLQNIAKPDGSYDFITLNQVLEFVPDAGKAFRELCRISSQDGLIQIGFSGAGSRQECVDFLVPHGPHGAYHLFGRDVAAYFNCALYGMNWIEVQAADDATGYIETFHFFCRDQAVLRQIDLAARNAATVA